MRKENAGFRTAFLSEEGSKLLNRDYFAYVELDNLACYVAADSLDDENAKNSAEIVVKTILREFTEHPSMSTLSIKRNLKKAHRELISDKDGMRLRASVSVFITDYVKFRYASVGNSRALLIRNDRILYESKDQSLTENMVEDEILPKDKAALHEERNNLYSYLGKTGKQPQIQISRKKKLANGDILILDTRGIWENCDNAELLDCAKEVSAPQELADNVEELILGKLKREIDNYTISVTFVDKVYLNPKKRMSLKKILAIVIPIAVILLVVLIAFLVRWRIREGKRKDMEQYIASAEGYVSYHNFEKASEEYKEAQSLAKALKAEKDQEEIEEMLLFLEQIIQGDAAMADEDYEKAGDFYQKAQELSEKMGNTGRDYLKEQQEKIADYQEVFELLDSGERKEDYGDYAGAIELYKQAKSMAGRLYDKETRNEALEKQRAAEEKLEELRQEELAALEERIQKAIEEEQVAQELEDQSLMNDKKNALEIESKGNELMKEEDYLSAITYFETAMGMYEDLEMPERVKTLSAQIESCKKLNEEAKRKAAEEAEKQSKEAEAAQEANKAAEEARQAVSDLKEAQTNQALEDAKKAAEEAKKAAEEAKKAAESKGDKEETDKDKEEGGSPEEPKPDENVPQEGDNS
ncbi:MAG: hypothetical protein K2H52_16390 [Lachnospiraceae bacterium]|nr:hypothetical protein [Lachnospiraceae bacterium]